MKQLIPTKYIPCLILGCGGLGLVLRWLLYATGVDDRGLLTAGNALHIACWVLTVAVAVFLAIAIAPLDGSNRYKANFPASVAGAVGSLLGAVGILVTVLTQVYAFSDTLTLLWKITGILSGVCLVVTAMYRLQGKRPFFLLHAAVCLFFSLHLANQYRAWSGNPQTQDYSFQLCACIALTLTAYYHTAFDVDLGKRRRQLCAGLLGVYLCCLCVVNTETPLLYLGCGAWSFTNLCSLTPRRRRHRFEQERPGEDAESAPQTNASANPDGEVN